MDITNKEIVKYCGEYSTQPSELCQELAAYTMEHNPLGRMVCGDLVASFLGFHIRSNKVKAILELGTFTGYSALAMAENLPSNGSVLTIDKNKKTRKFAQKYWDQSEHGQKITAISGIALDVIETLTTKFDLIFIDADKKNYLNYLKKCLTLLNDNGVIIVDNVLWSGKILEPITSEDQATLAILEFNKYVRDSKELYSSLLPIRDGLYLIQKS